LFRETAIQIIAQFVFGTSMTMGALVVEVPEPKAAAAPDMGGMGMM
jgi:hypothetical protein